MPEAQSPLPGKLDQREALEELARDSMTQMWHGGFTAVDFEARVQRWLGQG